MTKQALRASLTVVGLFLSVGAMADSPFDERVSASSIEQCVAQVSTQANYDDARGVRHEVTELNRQTKNQILRIESKVFSRDSGEVIRAYAATCVIGRDGSPKSLRISQTDTEA